MPKSRYADRGKAKPKSIRSKAKLSGKRKLSRFGKEQKQGYAGTATSFMTRTKAVKKLQIPLKDFRRLCILKGIYPRDPSKKTAGRNQTYYHIKDIQYLMHEPLLQHYRDLKAFMKKIRRAAGKNQTNEARRLYSERPTYTLDHLVRERYPRFTDALGDLDDALTMIHLFANLPAEGGKIRPEHTALAAKLAREWQFYVVRTKALRKSFLSIKGIYFQANVHGVPVTWMTPYKFSQVITDDVDYRIMQTFLEFYEVMFKFVLFKLFQEAGLQYPPTLDAEADAKGGHINTLRAEPLNQNQIASQVEMQNDETQEQQQHDKSTETGVEKLSTLAPKLQELADRQRSVHDSDVAEESDVSINDTSEDEDDENDEDFEQLAAGADQDDEQMTAILEARREKQRIRQFQRLFKGLTFFLGRETPVDVLEFVIKSLGGEVGFEGPASPFDVTNSNITHQICDRPTVRNAVPGREYIQPQWVFDSINAHMLLPIKRYIPGASLPPHLSPFMDDAAEGYIPAYRRELDSLRAAAGVISSEEAARTAGTTSGTREVMVQGQESEHDETDSEEESDAEAADKDSSVDIVDPSKKNARVQTSLGKLGRAPNQFVKKGKLLGDDALPGKKRRLQPATSAEQDKRELAASMLNAKQRRQYDIVQRSVRRNANYRARLESKRRKLEEQS